MQSSICCYALVIFDCYVGGTPVAVWLKILGCQHAVQDLFPDEKLSYTGSDPRCLMAHYNPTFSLPTCSRSPFCLRFGATWLSLGHERPWPNLEVLLLRAHSTGTSYLSPLETLFENHLISLLKWIKI